ncbi:MAG: DUF4097 family beta strand repeat protein [Firmicutes bacterium]|nr:DUF4097 family beta strand repeat protein [Bacillota bacterium]
MTAVRRSLHPALQAVILVSIIGGIVIAAAPMGSSSTRVDQVEAAFPLNPGETLTVLSRNGTITVETWDGNEVVIRAAKRIWALLPGLSNYVAERIQIDMARDEGGVRAEFGTRSPFDWLFANAAVDFHVRVPNRWSGRAELVTSNGNIASSGSRGDFRLHTSNGTITVESHQGALSVRTSNGRIRINGVEGAVNAETSNGEVRIEGARLSGAGTVQTSNGPIRLDGRILAGADYSVRTSNGSVTLVISQPDVSLDLSASNGSINVHAEVTASRVDRGRLVGRIGSGAARLVANTSNGSIELHTGEVGR